MIAFRDHPRCAECKRESGGEDPIDLWPGLDHFPLVAYEAGTGFVRNEHSANQVALGGVYVGEATLVRQLCRSCGYKLRVV